MAVLGIGGTESLILEVIKTLSTSYHWMAVLGTGGTKSLILENGGSGYYD